MKLPAAERAVVEPAKIRDYLLSTSHPVGRFKAPFFASLGYTSANWRRLEEDLRDLAVSGDAELGKDSPYGQKYEIHGTLKWPCHGRSAGVLTVWIILFGGGRATVRDCVPGRNDMMYKLLDTVVLNRDLPEHGLRNWRPGCRRAGVRARWLGGRVRDRIRQNSGACYPERQRRAAGARQRPHRCQVCRVNSIVSTWVCSE